MPEHTFGLRAVVWSAIASCAVVFAPGCLPADAGVLVSGEIVVDEHAESNVCHIVLSYTDDDLTVCEGDVTGEFQFDCTIQGRAPYSVTVTCPDVGVVYFKDGLRVEGLAELDLGRIEVAAMKG